MPQWCSTFAENVDYQFVNTTLTFNAVTTTVSFDVPLIDDEFVEGDETFQMHLELISNANIVFFPSDTALVTIEDDDSKMLA